MKMRTPVWVMWQERFVGLRTPSNKFILSITIHSPLQLLFGRVMRHATLPVRALLCGKTEHPALLKETTLRDCVFFPHPKWAITPVNQKKLQSIAFKKWTYIVSIFYWFTGVKNDGAFWPIVALLVSPLIHKSCHSQLAKLDLCAYPT